MSNKGEWVSIKEYAIRNHISQQAAYKAATAGKLISRESNGKKYVFLEYEEEQEEAEPQTEAQLVIKSLMKQLEEKDRQLERQAQLLEEQIKLAADINKTIEETTNALKDVAKIIQNEQLLKARSLIAEQAESAPAPEEYTDAEPAPAPEDSTEEELAPAPEQGEEKKPGFFARLFRGEF